MIDWRSYDDVAEVYERVSAPKFYAPARDLVSLVDPATGARVLDVGTGTGVATEAAAAAVGESGVAIGADLSVEMLRVGARARPGRRFVAASAVDLPFADTTFDAVVANFVVSHFPSYKTGLFDMIRVLRPGGRLAMSSWSDEQDELQKVWGELVESVVQHELLEGVWKESAPWHDRFRDRELLEETLLDAGLRHVRTEKKEYRFISSIDDYLAGLESFATGRFVRSMLGDGWEAFRRRSRQVFAERFPDPLNDFRDVLFGVATKP